MFDPIPTPAYELKQKVQAVIDQKTKPIGALGRLEECALQIAMMQATTRPTIASPTWLVFAADHGISRRGVSPYPSEVTAQMVANFLAGGAAINVFARLHNFDLKVVDAGVAAPLPEHPELVRRAVAPGTRDFLEQAAMDESQRDQALTRGRDLVRDLLAQGVNTFGFGEMGIGNSSSAAMLMHFLTGLDLEVCVGRGTGLTDEGLARKTAILQEAAARCFDDMEPLEVLRQYGGFEIAMMVGAMLAAAAGRGLIVVDGFIASAALLTAAKMEPCILSYCLFAHCSQERGHRAMLDYLRAKPLLQLDMRLGEGTGAAVALPLIRSAVAFYQDMASFDGAGVSQAGES
ncbi:nicotinate-nucleotide--dimethylbenzimidazole phosphoribosyltransferase [Acanthopleuribacter pedis]|uniref:Nicotinate-nucleotide--dimethylbenzimidazole phosphoribosyltransferase n=1 Tax=Acanthopleuribacter pedis TaxID=442870 RepID=A0A8J7QN68_9BACT|nr:nicotinate-nucleotide--dimethylbenzimidazole phosphoribosyltransferase [Acanthopleuribacter pedis]